MRISGAPKDLLHAYAESPYQVTLVYIRSFPNLAEFFEMSGAPTRPNPQLAPLKLAEAPDQMPMWHLCPIVPPYDRAPDLMHPSTKILRTFMPDAGT